MSDSASSLLFLSVHSSKLVQAGTLARRLILTLDNIPVTKSRKTIGMAAHFLMSTPGLKKVGRVENRQGSSMKTITS